MFTFHRPSLCTFIRERVSVAILFSSFALFRFFTRFNFPQLCLVFVVVVVGVVGVPINSDNCHIELHATMGEWLLKPKDNSKYTCTH